MYNPFQKLHTFRVKDQKTLCDCAPASPALRILSLSHRPWLTEIVTKRLLTRGRYSDRQYHPFAYKNNTGLGTRLHTLELYFIRNDLPSMESFIGRPNFWVTVKRLSLRRIGEFKNSVYDWSRMSTAITNNWPSLEHLEISKMHRNVSSQLGSFAGHDKLMDLV